jgi:hypothetical protein
MRPEARTLMMAGIGFAGVSVAAWIGAMIAGIAGQPGKVLDVGTFALIGATLFGLGALRLPGWARLRRRQMEEVAERLALASSSTPSGDSGEEESR